MKKIVIAGGSGFLGSCLMQTFSTDHQLEVLTRKPSYKKNSTFYHFWDAKNPGSWEATLEGAYAVINLTGKSVNCRYTKKNKQLICSSRVESTIAIGRAIQRCQDPPTVWINAASGTIYRHSLDKEMDEKSGENGTGFSVDVCQKWETAFNSIETPRTRKMLIRTGIVLGKEGGPLKPLKALATIGMGGHQGNGNQYFSWLHENDFVGIVKFLLANHKSMGIYNVTAPNPISNRHFMKALRLSLHIKVGLPLPKWLLESGAILIGTETELILKSRRVIPAKLLAEGYQFQFGEIEKALNHLCRG